MVGIERQRDTLNEDYQYLIKSANFIGHVTEDPWDTAPGDTKTAWARDFKSGSYLTSSLDAPGCPTCKLGQAKLGQFSCSGCGNDWQIYTIRIEGSTKFVARKVENDRSRILASKKIAFTDGDVVSQPYTGVRGHIVGEVDEDGYVEVIWEDSDEVEIENIEDLVNLDE